MGCNTNAGCQYDGGDCENSRRRTLENELIVGSGNAVPDEAFDICSNAKAYANDRIADLVSATSSSVTNAFETARLRRYKDIYRGTSTLSNHSIANIFYKDFSKNGRRTTSTEKLRPKLTTLRDRGLAKTCTQSGMMDDIYAFASDTWSNEYCDTGKIKPFPTTLSMVSRCREICDGGIPVLAGKFSFLNAVPFFRNAVLI